METNRPLLDHLEDRNILASIADIIGTMHKIDAKVTKLHEVVVGSKEFGQEGIIEKLKNIEEDIDQVKKYDLEHFEKTIEDYKKIKNRFIGFAFAAGVIVEIGREVVSKIIFGK